MNDAPHIGALFIAAQMHFNLTRRTQTLRRFHDIAVCINANQLFRRDKAFAHTGGSAKEGAVLQACRNVAVVCRNPSKLPHLVAHIADLFFDYLNIHLLYPFLHLNSMNLFHIAYNGILAKNDFLSVGLCPTCEL